MDIILDTHSIKYTRSEFDIFSQLYLKCWIGFIKSRRILLIAMYLRVDVTDAIQMNICYLTWQ